MFPIINLLLHFNCISRWSIFYLWLSATCVCQRQEKLTPLLNKCHKSLPQNKGIPFGPHLTKECKLNYEILDPRNIEAVNREIKNCHGTNFNCSDSAKSKYRSIDGSCNNLRNPSWGKSDICLTRILPFDYSDKLSVPRVSCTGKPLPNPRLVSNVFHNELSLRQAHFTTHFMEWGQMLAHDLSLNEVPRIQGPNGSQEPIDCCKQGPLINESCYSLAVPPNDPFLSGLGVTCINNVRTIPCNQCIARLKKRVHLNGNTAYHDLSLVYGSNEENAQKLRSGYKGLLIVEYNRESGPMPPTVFSQQQCTSAKRAENSCYKTGDPRSNQNPFILTVQTYLLRHHNFICRELSEINPHWDDERVYQEARRINIAIAQSITYSRYLPYVLGEIMQEVGIDSQPGVTYTLYDPNLDASIIDEYTTFAARYGHSLVPGQITEIDPHTEARNEIRLKDYYFTPFEFRYGQFDRMVKGMTVDRIRKHDTYLTDDVRNFLNRRLYLNEVTGIDLATISIVRGRDHGIPGYTYYQKYLFNRNITNFNDLRKVLPSMSVDALESLYDSVHDVDAYSAGLAEYYVRGGFVGRTFGTILGEQYRRLKFGDRYWFEHAGQVGSFTPEQLVEIKRMTLAHILCETTRIGQVQMDPFQPPSADNPVTSCKEIHHLDFSLWE